MRRRPIRWSLRQGERGDLSAVAPLETTCNGRLDGRWIEIERGSVWV